MPQLTDAERAEYDRIEARLAEPISRGEFLAALDTVASRYGAAGTHEGDLICFVFRALHTELE